MWRKAMILATAAVSLSACSWVQLTPQAEKVRVLSASEVTKCKNMGKTTASTTAKLAGVGRHPDVVQDELNRAARNAAVDMKGDTVAPLTSVVDGKQTFGVYRCVPE